MAIEILNPSSKAEWLVIRRSDITASVAGALFGIHDFLSPYELWAQKTGRLADVVSESDAMRRGRLLEPVAVQIIREERPNWRLEHNAADNTYYRDTESRLGGTPDVIAHDPCRGKGVVQIKSVESMLFRTKWKRDGVVDVPLWISLQASIEAHLTGAQWAAVAPLVIGFGVEMPIIDIPLLPEVIEAVKEETAHFWAMIERGEEPDPDYTIDGDVIGRLYPEARGGSVIDLSMDNRIDQLLIDRADAKDIQKQAEAQAKTAEAEIKAKMGDYETATLASGQKITWKTTHRKESVTKASSYRILRCPTPVEAN